ncbi:MAG: choice-of-anchor B family protein [Planctomycetota bacterium]
MLLSAAGAAAAAHPEFEALRGIGDAGEAARLNQFPSSNVTFLSRVSIAEMDPGSSDAQDCWGYVSPTGREIAIIGLRQAVSFVDITDPGAPVILDTFPAPSSPWHDIKTLGDHAYVVSEGGGHIQIFDLSDVDNGNVINRGFTSFGGSSASHNIVVNEESGFLYRVGGGNNLGLRAYSVGLNGLPGSPTQPVQSLVQSDLYVHDAQVVTYDSGPFAGREIAFCFSGFGNGSSDTTLRIFDVTNKSSIQQIGILDASGSGRYPGARFSHQGWLSEDRKYIYMNDEIDEGQSRSTTTLHIINVEDLTNPTYVRAWTNGNSSRDHNCYVDGDYLYAANYRSGLRIHDISDPENPVEVAWIDTFPTNDNNDGTGGFDGAWSSYPFFPSGNVIISDIQQGLVVVRPEIETLAFDAFVDLGDTTDPAGGEQVVFSIIENDVTLDPSSVRLVITLSDGTEIDVPGSVTNNVATFAVPPLECLEAFTYRVEASTTRGQTFQSETLSAVVATGETLVFSDNAESDPGWIVTGNASDGQWNRGVPVNAGRGDPSADADGSGRAWLTDNSSADGGNSDVDNGQTILTSPIIDASAGGLLRFSYWVGDIAGGPFDAQDVFQVQLSADGGGSWTTIRDITAATNSWIDDEVTLTGAFAQTSELRIRFIVADNDPQSVVEAGVDAVSLLSIECVDPGCTNPADVNGDGSLTPADFSSWILAFNSQSEACDQNGDGLCVPSDFSAWVVNFNAGGCD